MSLKKERMITNKKILIIGGTGSLGVALTKKYLETNDIFIYSRGENNQWEMKNKFDSNPRLHFFVGDIRDRERVETCLFRCKPNIIILAAALKHIDICEKNINECINTNVDGVRNVIHIVTSNAISNTIPFLESLVFISTDKACSPVNTYGMCKALSERIVIEKTEFLKSPKFVNVRYGNVLSSRGSIIPLFESIGKDPEKKTFNVTSDKMTRFFMTLEESTSLIESAILHGKTGETIIPKNIHSWKIIDIADYFSKKFKKPIKYIGIRPGEKLHESLISHTESLRTRECDSFYVVSPTYKKDISDTIQTGEINSSVTTPISILLKEISNI